MRKISVLLLAVMAFCTLSLSGAAISVYDASQVVYKADFEGVSISSSNTADNATGFVWVNRWQDASTERHNGSHMLKAPLYDSVDYSVLGGLGIASRSNLALCIPGESYEVTLYMEMHGLDYMFVEYVGGDEKWGSVIIYPDGTVTNNGSGDNICEVSYDSNILRFKFTMGEPFNDGGNTINGYIKFTGYNCSNAYVYMDDISIVKSESTYSEDFSKHSVGVLNTLDSEYFGKFYSTCNTEIVESAGNKYLKVSKNPTGSEATEMFFLNRLSVLNRGREYKVSIDLNTENVKKLYIYNVGTWNDPAEYMEINITGSDVLVNGEVLSNAIYKDGKLSFDFKASTKYSEYGQFQFIAEPVNTDSPIVINVDNISFVQVPIVTKIEISCLSSKFVWGASLNTSDFKVNAIYSDGTKREVDASLCEIKGYDKAKEGYQVLTFSYEGVSEKIIINVVRQSTSLILDTSSVKTEYRYGEKFDMSALEVYAVYLNGEEKQLSDDPICGGYSACLGGFDSHTPGTYTVKVTFGELTESFTVTVLPANSVDFSGVRYTPM